ncbi:MAG: histidinol-phosphatase [Bacteroidota bacterium]|nr:histidinol-phosphatase [Bacteroidota bacterium]MDP4205282.1 histidinol-phosphatase [Bacteroidota bacterium]
MNYYCYHTHSKFCDGASSLREMTEAAKANGVKKLGFSAHSPIPFENSWSLKMENFQSYTSEIEQLKKDFKGQIDLFAGMEADYTPGLSYSFDYLRKLGKLDFLIGSVHLVKGIENDQIWFIDGPSINYELGLESVFHGDIRTAVGAYFSQIQEMISTQNIDIIGHVDKIKMHNRNRYFSEEDEWYVSHVDKTIGLIRQSGAVVEVNTRGIYKGRSDSLFPGVKWLERFNHYGIPVTISTDAHHTSEILKGYDEAVLFLKEIGFKKIYFFDNFKWEECSLQ